MTFDEYQKQAITTNLRRDDQLQELMQQVLGLGDEAGEVQAIFKKWIRDNDADITRLDTKNVAKELGDVLWYIAVVAHDLGISFDEIAQANIDKLKSRQQRNVLAGSGRRPLMAGYDTARPHIACYLLVRNDAGQVAFVMRSNTSWMDGYYGLPAGKVEKGESFAQGAIREGKEEVGVDVAPSALRHVLTMHRREAGATLEWVDVFFEVSEYSGEVANAEPDKHSRVDWLSLEDLPDNVIPSLRYALERLTAGDSYVEYGWDGLSEDKPGL